MILQYLLLDLNRSLYHFGNELSKSTKAMRTSLPLLNSARSKFETPKLDLPSWAKSIPEYMDPAALKPAKQLRGFFNRYADNMVDQLKREDEKLLQKRIEISRDIYRSPLYKITYFSDGKHPTDDLPPVNKSYNQDLVQTYLDMLNSETNSKDMVITALDNLVQMIDYAITVIMGSSHKFMQF